MKKSTKQTEKVMGRPTVRDIDKKFINLLRYRSNLTDAEVELQLSLYHHSSQIVLRSRKRGNRKVLTYFYQAGAKHFLLDTSGLTNRVPNPRRKSYNQCKIPVKSPKPQFPRFQPRNNPRKIPHRPLRSRLHSRPIKR